MHDSDEETRRKWSKRLEKQQKAMQKDREGIYQEMRDVINSQCYAMVPYINSFEALQNLLPRNPRSGETNEQDSFRVMSFMDRDKSKGGPTPHPSAHKNLKDSDKRKEKILQNCNQKHPLYFFNNLGVLHLNTKKYSVACFFLTKALKYLQLDGKQNQAGGKNPMKFVSNHTSQKRAEIMYNLGLAFYKMGQYEKCVNCLAEASELYANKFSLWFWMGTACIKNFVDQAENYFMKSSSKTILTKKPEVGEIDEKVPEKMKLHQAIRYLENVIVAYQNFTDNEKEIMEIIKKFDFTEHFKNIPHIQNKAGEEAKDEKKQEEINDDPSFSMGLHSKAVADRYRMMAHSSYMLLIYAYLLLKNDEKALEYCKILKSDFKLNSKMSFDLKMYMAEIYLTRGSLQQAFKCLKIDKAFEERKGRESKEDYIDIENTNSGFLEKNLPKRAVMFLNIATCNYFLEIPEEARNAISNALDCLGLNKDENNPTRKPQMEEIPEFVLHSLVYLNLYNGDEETALKLLRKRRFDKNNEDLLDFGSSEDGLRIFR